MEAAFDEGDHKKRRKPTKSIAARRKVTGFVRRSDLGKAMGETSDGVIRGTFRPPIFGWYRRLQGVEMERTSNSSNASNSSNSSSAEKSWKNVVHVEVGMGDGDGDNDDGGDEDCRLMRQGYEQ